MSFVSLQTLPPHVWTTCFLQLYVLIMQQYRPHVQWTSRTYPSLDKITPLMSMWVTCPVTWLGHVPCHMALVKGSRETCCRHLNHVQWTRWTKCFLQQNIYQMYELDARLKSVTLLLLCLYDWNPCSIHKVLCLFETALLYPRYNHRKSYREGCSLAMCLPPAIYYGYIFQAPAYPPSWLRYYKGKSGVY
jgi:hypothetical protein